MTDCTRWLRGPTWSVRTRRTVLRDVPTPPWGVSQLTAAKSRNGGGRGVWATEFYVAPPPKLTLFRVRLAYLRRMVGTVVPRIPKAQGSYSNNAKVQVQSRWQPERELDAIPHTFTCMHKQNKPPHIHAQHCSDGGEEIYGLHGSSSSPIAKSDAIHHSKCDLIRSAFKCAHGILITSTLTRL